MFICRTFADDRIGMAIKSQKLPTVKPVPYNYGPIGDKFIAQHVWSIVVKPGDIVIDATCGNGYDSIKMAKLALTETVGKLYCIDIQQCAIDNTIIAFRNSTEFSDAFKQNISERVIFMCCDHINFPPQILPNTVSLITYNLGYLPGQPRGKEVNFIQTDFSTTTASLRNAAKLVKEGGLLSITAYPGHKGGETELYEVQKLLSSFDQEDWRIHSHAPLNRPLLPTLFLAFKIEKFNYLKSRK